MDLPYNYVSLPEGFLIQSFAKQFPVELNPGWWGSYGITSLQDFSYVVPITGQKDETTKVTSGGQTYSMRMCNLKETYLNMSSMSSQTQSNSQSP